MTDSEKTPLRKLCLQQRSNLSRNSQKEKSKIISELLKEIISEHSKDKVIALYHPMDNEVDIMQLADLDVKTCLPCVEEKDSPLVFRQYHPKDKLVNNNKLPFMEPNKSSDICTPNIIIVPMVGFDKKGNRLGYGGGYYDRTIEKLRKKNPDILLIGVAFSCQEVAKLPISQYDQSLDIIITESGNQICGK